LWVIFRFVRAARNKNAIAASPLAAKSSDFPPRSAAWQPNRRGARPQLWTPPPHPGNAGSYPLHHGHIRMPLSARARPSAIAVMKVCSGFELPPYPLPQQTAGIGATPSLPRNPVTVPSPSLCRPYSPCIANRWLFEFTTYALNHKSGSAKTYLLFRNISFPDIAKGHQNASEGGIEYFPEQTSDSSFPALGAS
jgi:hypothetical protein